MQSDAGPQRDQQPAQSAIAERTTGCGTERGAQHSDDRRFALLLKRCIAEWDAMLDPSPHAGSCNCPDLGA
jgi:hypothetical protein